MKKNEWHDIKVNDFVYKKILEYIDESKYKAPYQIIIKAMIDYYIYETIETERQMKNEK